MALKDLFSAQSGPNLFFLKEFANIDYDPNDPESKQYITSIRKARANNLEDDMIDYEFVRMEGIFPCFRLREG